MLGKPVLAHNQDGDFYVFPEDCFISRELLQGNRWDNTGLSWFCKHVTEDAVVLDIGANLGTHTVCYAKHCPKGFVHAFEPHKVIFNQLVTNCFINGLHANVKCYNLGLGDFTATIMLPNDPRDCMLDCPNNYGNIQLNVAHNPNVPSHQAVIGRLDWVLQLERLDFIKLDVEHMEASVLRGGELQITKFKPFICFESWQAESETHEWCRAHGYKVEPFSHLNYLAVPPTNPPGIVS